MAKKVTKKKVAKKKTTKKKVAKKAVSKKKVVKKVAKKAPAAKKKVVKKKAAKKVTKVAKKKVVKKKAAKKIAKKVAKKVAKKTATKKTVAKKAVKKVAKKVAPKAATKPVASEKVEEKTVKPVEINEKTSAKRPTKAEKAVEFKNETAKIKEDFVEEIMTFSGEYSLNEIIDSLKHLEYFAGDGDECLEKGCDNLATTLGLCRFHYIKNWQSIKKKQQILKEGKLQLYVEELISKYPLKYIEGILSDLTDEKKFFKALGEMNISSEEDEIEEYMEDDGDDQDIIYQTKGSSSKSVFNED